MSENEQAAGTFDMRRFAPPTGVTVAFRNGTSFRLPGDPDVDDVAIMLRLETEINEKNGVELGSVLTEGKETLKRLILTADPEQDVSKLRVGPEEMLVIFALLVHGSTVAEAVGVAITAHNTAAGESLEEESEEERELRVAAEVGDEPGPLSPSASSSPAPSSGSADVGASLPATG